MASSLSLLRASALSSSLPLRHAAALSLPLARASSSSPGKSKMIENISRLRRETGASMARCREALAAVEGDYLKALNWIETNNHHLASSRAFKLSSRNAAEGLVGVSRHPSLLRAAMVEINCETDFVARGEQFQALVARITSSLLSLPAPAQGAAHFAEISPEEVKKVQGVEEALISAVGSLGENIVIRRAMMTSFPHGLVVPAVHDGTPDMGRYAALLLVRASSQDPALLAAADPFVKKVAKHVVGMNPSSVAQALEQPFLFEPEQTLGETLERLGKKLGASFTLEDFKRFECGETAEKKTANFADEVQEMLRK